jgi:hypothetical protein
MHNKPTHYGPRSGNIAGSETQTSGQALVTKWALGLMIDQILKVTAIAVFLAILAGTGSLHAEESEEQTPAGSPESDPHSPLEYRVNGPYPNIDAFHEAFGTQEGDGMWLPPDERVRIW